MPTQMRAVLIKDGVGPIENLYIGETEKPSVKPGYVLVKVKAFGLNRMDLLQRNGGYPVPPGASTILGVEFSGHVVELGEGVADWKLDDEVLGLAGGGAYAEYILVYEKHIFSKPPAMSWVEAASIPENFLTVFQALFLVGDMKPGADVLIHTGASGIGIAAAQLARLFGANTVTSTVSTQEKIDWLLSTPNGPTHAVNYRTSSFAEAVKKTTNGKGVDLVIDPVGQSHFAQNLDALAMDGHMTMLGLLSGAVLPEKTSIGPLLMKRLRVQGSTLRSRTKEYQTDLIQRFKNEVFGRIVTAEEKGHVKIYIHKVYPWSEIQDAQREMAADKNIGKIVCEVV